MKPFSCTATLIALTALGYRELSAEPAPPPPPTDMSTSANAGEPRIAFASTTYEFGRVSVGDVVRHDFIFTNTGDAVLEVSGVYPKCGCTIAGAWSRQVQPGQVGVIPLQFNSSHFGGMTVDKEAVVMSTDKKDTAVTLHLKGTIWKPIEVNPQMAFMNLIADASSNASTTLHIVSSLDEPVTLSEPVSSNPTFAAELKTIKPGKEFELVVQALPPLKQGSVQGTITMKTSSTNAPTIEVNALAVVQPEVMVAPPQVSLPPGPLAVPFPCSISIRGMGATPLTLAEPSLSLTNVDVQVKTVQEGKYYVVMMTFPAGFQLTQTTEAHFMVKTSNPRYPEIKVPIRQVTRPPVNLTKGPNRGPAIPGATLGSVPPK